MLLEELRRQVLDANLEIVRQGLVLYTFGNVSGIDRASGLVAIKPSGVDYATMRPEDIVITDLEGKVVEGKLRPSSDLATHLVFYKHFPSIGGVTHTHSEYATAWAQARRPIPCLGTTHADYFYGPVPVSQDLTKQEIEEDYELNTGLVVTRTVSAEAAAKVPAVLVAGHGPFTWGKSAMESAHHAAILEYVAKMASHCYAANPAARELPAAQRDKHYERKHGANAYYGQPDKR
jgi:L-ribulose-5-phosphate 4-epimerase